MLPFSRVVVIAVQTVLPPVPVPMLGHESVGTSSVQAFQNNNAALQFQEEISKGHFQKAASVFGKHRYLCGNHIRHGAGYKGPIACCCEKPLPPAAL